jgi:hypothetical protein
LAELFAKQGDLDSNALKDLRAEFASDFDGYVDNLLAPEKRATSPTATTHCLSTIHDHLCIVT